MAQKSQKSPKITENGVSAEKCTDKIEYSILKQSQNPVKLGFFLLPYVFTVSSVFSVNPVIFGVINNNKTSTMFVKLLSNQVHYQVSQLLVRLQNFSLGLGDIRASHPQKKVGFVMSATEMITKVFLRTTVKIDCTTP